LRHPHPGRERPRRHRFARAGRGHRDSTTANRPGRQVGESSRSPDHRCEGALRGAGLHRHPHAQRHRHPRRADGRVRGPPRGDDHVIGNCGDSPAPISEGYRELATRRFEYYAQGREWDWTTYGEYLDFMEANGVGVNIAGLVGHGAVRTAVMGFDERAPNRGDMRSMKAHVEEAMAAGAFGMSTGLVYPPGCFAATEEIVELAKVVARHGGFYASHIRGERETIVDAVEECIDIGERAGCPVQISHNNPKYGGIGKSSEIQHLWEAARQRGVDVLADNDAHT